MFRAVMNVIQNAVEHTKENGIIYIDAKEQDGRLTFIVEDSGSGFTKEALLHGTEQFFITLFRLPIYLLVIDFYQSECLFLYICEKIF